MTPRLYPAGESDSDPPAISPELVLVDPELARRLQEHDRVRARRRPPLPALHLLPEMPSEPEPDDDAGTGGGQALL